ncbi:unnamed protein product [Camellia sinensis]
MPVCVNTLICRLCCLVSLFLTCEVSKYKHYLNECRFGFNVILFLFGFFIYQTTLLCFFPLIHQHPTLFSSHSSLHFWAITAVLKKVSVHSDGKAELRAVLAELLHNARE